MEPMVYVFRGNLSRVSTCMPRNRRRYCYNNISSCFSHYEMHFTANRQMIVISLKLRNLQG